MNTLPKAFVGSSSESLNIAYEIHLNWRQRKLERSHHHIPKKNSAADALPVLTCSKHLGFVDSLGFFKNQVFSKDTSTYKIIKRGQIGYPANHVEEGSIGLQNLYDVALVSPIYVVFSVNEGVDSFFLHRVLKLDSYRQKFKMATTSSVDRRGSLRWPAFSKITVSIPPLPEQQTSPTFYETWRQNRRAGSQAGQSTPDQARHDAGTTNR
jgi:type I restriction enzyme S subunit